MKSKFRKLTAWLLTSAMLFTLLPATAFAIPATHSHPICGAAHTDIGDHTGTCENVDWTAWDGTTDFPGGNVYLSADVTLEKTLEISSGTVNLCLNGKVLRISENAIIGAVIEVSEGAELNLCDCQNTEHKFTPDGNELWVLDEESGTKSVYGGVITGGNTTVGSAICSDGTLRIYGGNIVGNHATARAVVHSTGAEFSMYGGSICGNTGDDGNDGVGLCLWNNTGKQQIRGGKIYENTAAADDSPGGVGVYVSQGNLTISGAVEIYDNKRGIENDNIYVAWNRSSQNEYSLIIDGELTNTTPIGVWARYEDIIIKADGTNVTDLTEYMNNFTSDNTGRELQLSFDKTNIKLLSPHSHAICGAETCTADHNLDGTAENHQSVTWTAWDGTDMDEGEAGIQLNAGNYYLTKDVIVTSDTRGIHPVGNVALCLNGHTISCESGAAITATISFDETDDCLTLTDCAGTGLVTRPADDVSVTIWISSGKLEQYGGTIQATAADNQSTAIWNQNNGTFSQYGGKIESESIGIYSLNESTVNLYGGTIEAAIADIYVRTEGAITLSSEISKPAEPYSIVADFNTPFTSGWNTYMSSATISDYFIPYSSEYIIKKNASTGELVFDVKPTTYTVKFDANGGTTVSGQTVEYGSKIEEPTAPTMAGYTFAGWYKDSGLATAWDFNADIVTEPTTLYAKWTANTNTPYVVNHWVQTLDAAINGNAEKNETNYTLNEDENLTGTTDATFKANTKEIDGFEAPDKENITIAADGSTVHNYYYTRNKYNIVINTDEGVEALSGNGQYYYEQTVDISATLKSGYKWNEWIANETGYGSANISYSFNMPAKALVLSPKTSSKAEVSINTDVQNYTYDKSAQAFEIKGTDLTGFTISYEQNGIAVTPINAGFYDVILSRAEDENYKEYSKTLVNGLIINKVIIDEPLIIDKPYNGFAQTADISDTEIYEVTENAGGTNVGAYDVVLTLKDSSNYKWSLEENSGATATRKFYITFVENSWNETPEITGWAYGDDANAPEFDAKFGTVKVEYKKASEEDSSYTTDIPENAGDYKVKFTVEANTNFGSLSEILDLTIAKAIPSLEAPAAQNDITYGAALSTVGLTEGWTWLDGTTIPTVQNSGFVAYFTPDDTDNYDWTVINGWDATEERVERTVTVTVDKATPSYITPANLTATYGQTLADVQGLTTGFTFMGEDTTSVGNAGNNTFKLKFTPADTHNYNVVENIDATVTVAQKEIGIEWGNTEFIYNKTEQKPTATATGLVAGDSCTITVTGGQTNAGNGYVATAESLSNANYKLPASKTTTFSIAQKSVTIAGVTIEATKVYDRETNAAITNYGTVSNVIDGDNVTVDTASASATYNDKYVGNGKSVTFTGFAITGTDAGNYVLSGQPESQSANITPKPVTITGVMVAVTKIYDANVTASIENNGSVDGVISGDAVDVNSSSATAVYDDANVGTDKAVTFVGFTISGADASNYELSTQPASATANITAKDITDAEITLGEALIYNGNAQSQTIASAIVDGLTITCDVSGNVNTDAGDYTLTTTGNGNFKGTAQKTYTIARADATLGTAPSAITPLTYNSVEQILVNAGENVVGGTLMYKLGEGEYSAEIPKATNAGTYTVYYKVVGDNNHNDVIEQSFEVTIAEKVVSPVVVLAAPMPNQTPQTSIETDEYSATITWFPAVTDKFAYSTDYTATVAITPKANYTLTGISENGYTIEGATVTNSADSGVITAVFPKTGSRPSSGGGVSKYTVKFETNGGTTVANKSVTRNALLAEPTAPTKDGYTFDGWYTDKELATAYDFDTKVTKNITLYAKWEKHDDESDEPDNTVSHNCPSKEFDDLDVNAWYHLDTDYVIENGIFKGVTENEFAPNANLTRAMLVTVLYRLEGEPRVSGITSFADLEKGQYYLDAVCWAQINGIVNGTTDTTFAPNDNITREQIAAIMHRYAQYKGYDVSVGENTNILSYDDFDNISEYAIASMQYAAGSGLMKGKTTSTLNPLDNATRAEIAAILHRFIEANK